MTEDFVRPRIVLITTLLADGAEGQAALRSALSGGDVASVIIEPAGRGEAAFQEFAEALVPLIQEAGAAAIVADDTRCAGRVGADGLHLSSGDIENLREAVARFSPRLIVGASGFKTRHGALDAGELLPDYLMFGTFRGDTHPEPHRKNVELAEWWADIVELPCVLLGGAAIDTLDAAASTGAEFIALSSAVFAEAGQEAARVRTANAMLDRFAEGMAA